MKKRVRTIHEVGELVGYEQREFEALFQPEPCREPTAAEPGTPEKIAVYRERAELGVELFHPHDRTLYGGRQFVLG